MICKVCGNNVNDIEKHVRKLRCFDYFVKKNNERGIKAKARGGGNKTSETRYSVRRSKLKDSDVLNQIIVFYAEKNKLSKGDAKKFVERELFVSG